MFPSVTNCGFISNEIGANRPCFLNLRLYVEGGLLFWIEQVENVLVQMVQKC